MSTASRCQFPCKFEILLKLSIKYIAFLNFSGGNRSHDQRVRVQIAVVGHSRGEGLVAMNALQKALRFTGARCPGQSGGNRQCACQYMF